MTSQRDAAVESMRQAHEQLGQHAADAARHSEEHAAILGHAPRAALVHRNHMALL